MVGYSQIYQESGPYNLLSKLVESGSGHYKYFCWGHKGKLGLLRGVKTRGSPYIGNDKKAYIN